MSHIISSLAVRPKRSKKDERERMVCDTAVFQLKPGPQPCVRTHVANLRRDGRERLRFQAASFPLRQEQAAGCVAPGPFTPCC